MRLTQLNFTQSINTLQLIMTSLCVWGGRGAVVGGGAWGGGGGVVIVVTVYVVQCGVIGSGIVIFLLVE